jgi:Flp pilus assembly pilin Flp
MRRNPFRKPSTQARDSREFGATAVEYALLIGLVAIGTITSTVFLKTQMASAFNKVGNALGSAGAVAPPTCEVSYVRDWQMYQSFGASVHVKNLGGPVSPWTMTWTLQAGETFVGGYSAQIVQNGTSMTATPEPWNQVSLSTDGVAYFGYGIDNSTSPTTPQFFLNGKPCTAV